jgi:adenine-specific DNA-methyltransferase
MMPEQISRESSSEERLGILRDLFPEVFTDGRVNVELLRKALEGEANDVSDTDHYGLRWPGKLQARRLANQPPRVTLRPVPDAGIDEDNTSNMVIIGDNMQVLLALQKSYASAIKLIYIDPPYNTGNDFIYKDSFAVDEEQYLQETRQADIQGRLVSNPQSNGRFHSNWLNFIYPRLKVARNLLRDDGAIFVSIDDNEAHNLRLAMDEIFGAENFVASIAWEKRYTRSNNAKMFYSLKDTILVYRKSHEVSTLREKRSEKADSGYANPDNDPNGPWTTSSYVNPATKDRRPNLVYDITSPDGRVVKHPTHAWKYARDEYLRHVAENRLWWGASGDAVYPRKKIYLNEADGMVPIDLWDYQTSGTTDEGGTEVKLLFDGVGVFDNPKPTKLIRRIMGLATRPNQEEIVLDFFAGSGSTGHALWLENANDGGNRRFILVQLPETTAQPSAYETIDQVTCERLRRASRAIKADGAKGDFGFRVFKEDSPALARPLHLLAGQLDKEQLEIFSEKLSHIQPSNLFAEVLLLLGYPLDANCEQVPQESANTLWRFDHPRVPQPLLLCLDPEIDDELLDTLREMKHHIFVCRDEALTDVSKARFYDALKLAESTFKVL